MWGGIDAADVAWHMHFATDVGCHLGDKNCLESVGHHQTEMQAGENAIRDKFTACHDAPKRVNSRPESSPPNGERMFDWLFFFAQLIC